MNVVAMNRVVGRRQGRYALAAVRRVCVAAATVRIHSWKVLPDR